MRRFALVISLLAAVGFALPAAADTIITGEKKGAFFHIRVPTVWNGNLVIYNHGFDFDFIGSPNLGPIAPLWLSQGYAIAASGHSMSGWVLFNSKRDTERMVDVFTAEFGAPNDVYVAGFSLGGIVTAQLVEKLSDIGVDEREVNIRNKLARGKFSAAFFIQCLSAIGCHTLRLESD